MIMTNGLGENYGKGNPPIDLSVIEDLKRYGIEPTSVQLGEPENRVYSFELKLPNGMSMSELQKLLENPRLRLVAASETEISYETGPRHKPHTIVLKRAAD